MIGMKSKLICSAAAAAAVALLLSDAFIPVSVASPAASLDRIAAINNLIRWFSSSGGWISNDIRVSEMRGNVGWFAAKQLSTDTVVLRLPLRLSLKPDYDVSEMTGFTDPVLLLAYSLLMPPDEQWRIYIASLPWNQPPRSPIRCSQSSLAQLNVMLNPEIVKKWASYTAFIEVWYQSAKEAISPEELTLGRWKAAVAIVLSRVHHITVDSDRTTVALFPVLDMFNYGAPYNTRCETTVHNHEGIISCKISRSVQQGEELLVGYGKQGTLTEEQLLFNYGFTLSLDWHQTSEVEDAGTCVDLRDVAMVQQAYEYLKQWEDYTVAIFNYM